MAARHAPCTRILREIQGTSSSYWRRETRSAAGACLAGPRRRPEKLLTVRRNILSAQARFAERLASTAGKAACDEKPVPPPRHDPSGNTGSSRAPGAGNEAAVNQEDSCRRARGNLLGAGWTLPRVRRATPTRVPPLSKRPSQTRSRVPQSARDPEFLIGASLG